MHKRFLQLLTLFIFVSSCAQAQDDYSLRIFQGKASDSYLGQILIGDIKGYEYDLKVTALDAGYLLKAEWFEDIDLYFKGGLSYFDESGVQDDIYEGALYFKVYWKLDFLDNRVRLGLGEGVSYVSDTLIWEKQEAEERSDNTSKFLNYLDVTLDLDLGRLVSYKPLYNTTLGMGIKHRSGARGLIGSVKYGGSNYPGFYIESNF